MTNKSTIVFACLLILQTILTAQPSDQAISQKATVLLADAYDKGVFSGVAVIAKNGKAIFSTAIGFAEGQTKRPINKSTLFNIGSLNKKFTQEIIRQLVSENKLAYTDALGKYLDLYPTAIGNKITIQQLLDMKAGLGDFLQDAQYIEQLQFTDFTLQDLLTVIKKQPLLFEPGTNTRYSNSGYAVLGGVIEKITGKRYQENLRERIAAPLDIKNLLYTKADIIQQTDRAVATAPGVNGQKTTIEEIANSTPAGGMYTNMDDLLKFVEVILMPQKPEQGKQGVPLFAGGSPGWSSALSYDHLTGYSVIVLANMGEDIAVKLTKRLNSIIQDKPYPPLEMAAQLPLLQLINEKGYGYIKANAKHLAAQQGVAYDGHFLNDAARRFLDSDQPAIAIELFKVNLELFPTSVFTCDMLAQTCLKTGDKTSALKYFKMVLDMDPNDERVKRSISNLQGVN